MNPLSRTNPPKGYRIRKVGEIRRASDLVWTFNIDDPCRRGRIACHYKWQKPDWYDKYLIGRLVKGVGGTYTPWAAKISKRKKKAAK